MSDKATFQDQQLVILAMAEGFIRKSDPALSGYTLHDLIGLWTDLVPSDYEEMAAHLMTACTMLGYILWEYTDDTDFAVAEYRDRILASPGGLLGGADEYEDDWDLGTEEDYRDEGY